MSDYVLNLDPIVVSMNVDPRDGHKSIVKHKFRRPTFKEEEKREAMMPIVTEETGVKPEEGSAAPSLKMDDETAHCWLYDQIIVSVEGKGYGLAEETPAEKEVNGKKLKDVIPSGHKTTAIHGIFSAAFDLAGADEDSDDEFVFDLFNSRSWTVEQKIGGGEFNPDGTLQDPDFVVSYTLSEPTEKHRKKFKLDAMSNNPYIKKGGLRVDRQSANLRVLSGLFDSLIESVEGAVVMIDGKEVAVDPRNKAHLEAIPAFVKKNVIRVVFNALEAELGN